MTACFHALHTNAIHTALFQRHNLFQCGGGAHGQDMAAPAGAQQILRGKTEGEGKYRRADLQHRLDLPVKSDGGRWGARGFDPIGFCPRPENVAGISDFGWGRGRIIRPDK